MIDALARMAIANSLRLIRSHKGLQADLLLQRVAWFVGAIQPACLANSDWGVAGRGIANSLRLIRSHKDRVMREFIAQASR